MRACIVAYSFYEQDHRVRRYAEALASRGDMVDVIALRKPSQGRTSTLAGVGVRHIQYRNYREKNIVDYVLRIVLFMIKGSLILSLLQLRYQYEVIHVHNVPDFLVFMALVPKLVFGARLILDIHDILPEFFAQKFRLGMKSAQARFLLFLERASVRFADHVIVANDLWLRKIIDRTRIAHNRCTSIPNYPDLKYFKVSHRSNGRSLTIIYPGTISEHHGVDLAIKAVAVVKEKIPDILMLIYAHAKGSKLFELVGDLGLKDNVEFRDVVPPERLSEIYAEADIGVVPKRGGVFADEALSTKIFDFMAAGIPVVASRTRIEEYYFNDSMISFFEPGNWKELAQRIIELSQDASLESLRVEAGERFIAENNWELKQHVYYGIISSLLPHEATRVSSAVKIYHFLKPLLPRRAQVYVRSLRARYILNRNANSWPIQIGSERKPSNWLGWPHGKSFAFVLTHDVDTARGFARCRELAEAERERGFQSAFFLVPQGYAIDAETREDLLSNGSEIGLHGLVHDARTFCERKIFDARLPLINRYLEEWSSVGFRAPLMIHNLDWIGELNIEYDASTFDCDPFEPLPEGVKTIFPFVYRNAEGTRSFIELPYTLCQDFGLFIILGAKDDRIWREKLDWIVDKGGMALLNTHPDYMYFGHGPRSFQEYPIGMYKAFLDYVRARYEGAYWNPLPRELASYWRSRYDDCKAS